MSSHLNRGRPGSTTEYFTLELLEMRRLFAAPALDGLYHNFYAFSQPRADFATARVGDDLLFAGGDFKDSQNNLILSDVVDIYHANNGQWSEARLSQARANIRNVVVAGTRALFINGQSGNDYKAAIISVIDVFDAATNSWTSATLPHPGDGATPVAVGDQVVFAGGYAQIGGQSQPSNQVDIYHTATGLWTSSVLSQLNGNAIKGVVGTKAIFGGNSGNQIEIYDAASGTWSSAQLSSPGLFFAVTVDGKLALFSSGAVDLFDPATGRLSSTAISRGNLGNWLHTVAGTKVVFAGGVYDAATGAWTVHANGLSGDPGATAVGTKAIFAGGSGPFNPGGPPSFYSSIEIYDTATDQWSRSSISLSAARGNPVAFTEGNLAVFGPGRTFFPGPSVDVYDSVTGQWSSTMLTEANYGTSATSADGQLLFGATRGMDLFAASGITEPANPIPAAGGGSASTPAVFRWDASPEAASYDVYLDDALVANVNTNQWTVDRNLSAGPHAWQVVARAGTAFTAGPRWTFDIGAPAIVKGPTPADHAILPDSPVTLSWQPSVGATSYDVYLDGALFGNVARNNTLLGRLLPGGTHNWRVDARNGFTVTAGPTWTFSTPSSGLTHSTKTLSSHGDVKAVTVDQVALFASNVPAGYAGSSTAVDVYNGATHAWSTAALSQARSNFTTATVGHKAIFAGGEINRPQYSNAVDIYDAASRRWSTAKLSLARADIAATTVGTDVLFAGGSTDTGFTDVVDIYRARTNGWSTAKLSQGRYGVTAASVGHFAFFAGGTIDNTYREAPYSNVVDIYDAHRHRWTTAHLSVARAGITAVTIGTKVMFAGGYNGNFIASDVVDIYDLATGKWSATKLPEARGGATAIAVGNKVVLAGGSIDSTDIYNHPNGDSDIAEIYDAYTGIWTTTKLKASRSYEKVLALGKRVIIAGGTANSGYSSSVIDVLDTGTGRETLETLAPLSSYYSVAGITVGRTAIFASGSALVGVGGAVADLYTA